MAESDDENEDGDLEDGIEIKEQKEDIDIMNKSLAATSIPQSDLKFKKNTQPQ